MNLSNPKPKPAECAEPYFLKSTYQLKFCLQIPILSIFSKRISRFLKVRENLFQEVDKDIDRKKKYIWMHAASLGEYELAIPLIKEIKKTFFYN